MTSEEARAIWEAHNAPLVEGKSAPNADPKQQCQCDGCETHRTGASV